MLTCVDRSAFQNAVTKRILAGFLRLLIFLSRPSGIRLRESALRMRLFVAPISKQVEWAHAFSVELARTAKQNRKAHEHIVLASYLVGRGALCLKNREGLL